MHVWLIASFTYYNFGSDFFYSSWTIGTSLDDQQVGNTWALDNLIVSISLSGSLTYIDPRASSPVHTIYAHQKAITSLASTPHGLITGSYDGRTFLWSDDSEGTKVKLSGGEVVQGSNAVSLGGSGHGNQVSGMCTDKGVLYTVGMDDVVKKVDLETKAFTYVILYL